MDNVRYPYGNQKILEGDIHWLTDPLKIVLVGTQDYTYSSIHQSLADVAEDARVVTSGTLTGRTSTYGVADADDVSFGTVNAGPRIDAAILYKDTGTESSSTLIAYMPNGNGLPIYPDGSIVRITWDNGARKIFIL